MAAGFSLQCLFSLSSFLSNKFSDLYILLFLSPLHPIKAFMLAAPKLIKANYQVTHLQAFAEDSVFCIFYFSSEKKGKQKTPVRRLKSCTSERQRAFRAFRGDVMGNWVLGETCGKSRNCLGTSHLVIIVDHSRTLQGNLIYV